MVRAPYFDKNGMKKGEWSEDEDNKLRAYIHTYGHSNWRQLPRLAGLSRCGKSCRLRWMNYLRPGLKHGKFTKEEEDMIDVLHKKHGNKWSLMAARLPGRSDNEIKNYWHTRIKNRRPAAGSKDQSTTDQLMNELEAVGSCEPAKECLIESWSLENQEEEEVETLLAVLSSELPMESSSSCCSLSVSDYEVTPHAADEFYKPAAGAEEENIINPYYDIINGHVDVVYSSSSNYNTMMPLGLAEVEDLITTTQTQQLPSFQDYNYITDDGLVRLW